MGLGCGFSRSPAVQPNPPPVPPWSIIGLEPYLWLRADSGDLTIATGVSVWPDQSGNGRNFSQATGSLQPALDATWTNGHPAVKGDGADDILTGPDMSSITGIGSADLFIVMRLVVDPPFDGLGGCWHFNDAAQEDYMPFWTGDIYCGSLRSTRISTAVAMGADYFETPRLVEIQSAPAYWKMRIDDVEKYSTGTNTVHGSATPALLGWAATPSVRMKGGISEVLLFAPGLADEDRALVRAELADRWGLSL